MVQGDAGGGKGGGHRGMGVDHGPDGGVLLIDPQVHLGLRGGFAGAFQDGSVQGHLYQHVLGHVPLTHPGGGDPEGIFPHPDGEVAVVGGHQPPLVDLPPGGQDVGLGLGVGGIGNRNTREISLVVFAYHNHFTS